MRPPPPTPTPTPTPPVTYLPPSKRARGGAPDDVPPLSRGRAAAPGGRHPADTEAHRRADLARALTIAKWTDARFVDPVLGLVLPGVGDVLGAAAGLYIVMLGARHGVPRTVLARMLFNVATDCLAGVVPVLGDLVDVVNRANLRNARLLQQHLGDPEHSAGGAPRLPGAATEPEGGGRSLLLPIILLTAAVAVAIAVAYLMIRRFWQ